MRIDDQGLRWCAADTATVARRVAGAYHLRTAIGPAAPAREHSHRMNYFGMPDVCQRLEGTRFPVVGLLVTRLRGPLEGSCKLKVSSPRRGSDE